MRLGQILAWHFQSWMECPFIRLPCQMSLGIIDKFSLDKVNRALSACKMLRHTALCRGDASRVFSDYGKTVTYACVGPQPSRNSKTVRTHTPFTLALPDQHWRTLVWMMTFTNTLCACYVLVVAWHVSADKIPNGSTVPGYLNTIYGIYCIGQDLPLYQLPFTLR